MLKILYVFCLLISYLWWDDEARAAQVVSGTGFFVSNRGHIVTNEHVVKGCLQVRIRGAVEPMSADVIGYDQQNDLALLKANVSPPRFAILKNTDERVKAGDSVIIIGYPLEHGISGQYVTRQAKIIGLGGPMNEEKWIQFTDSVAQGNSGGPLLDAGGNVLGVVVGKATLTKRNTVTGKEEVSAKSDIAISLKTLQQFLKQNNVAFRTSVTSPYISSNRVEYKAQDFIVNVHCIKG